MKVLQYAWIVALAFMLTTCDIIDNPVKVGANGCTVPEPDFTPRTDPERKVLIEDFTGHRCGNCPRAAEELHDLEEQHEGQVIGISYHSVLSGYFTGLDVKFSYDFTTNAAKEWDTKFGISGQGIPRGMVNRTKVSGSTSYVHTNWAGVVNQQLALTQDMDIQIDPTYDAIEGKLCAYVYAQALNDLPGTYKLVVYLTEDKFINWQKDYTIPSEDIQFYEHSHVFRKEMTTILGKTIATDGITSGQEIIHGFSIDFDNTKWNPDNCSVIAFVYDDVTGEVIQAEKQAIQ